MSCPPSRRLPHLTLVQGFGMMVSPSGSPERMSRPLSQPGFRRNGGSSSGSQVRGLSPTVVDGGHWLGGRDAQVAAAATAVPGCAWLGPAVLSFSNSGRGGALSELLGGTLGVALLSRQLLLRLHSAALCL